MSSSGQIQADDYDKGPGQKQRSKRKSTKQKYAQTSPKRRKSSAKKKKDATTETPQEMPNTGYQRMTVDVCNCGDDCTCFNEATLPRRMYKKYRLQTEQIITVKPKKVVVPENFRDSDSDDANVRPDENNQNADENHQIPDENHHMPAENRQIPDENRQIPAENRQIPDENRQAPGENRQIPEENEQNRKKGEDQKRKHDDDESDEEDYVPMKRIRNEENCIPMRKIRAEIITNNKGSFVEFQLEDYDERPSSEMRLLNWVDDRDAGPSNERRPTPYPFTPLRAPSARRPPKIISSTKENARSRTPDMLNWMQSDSDNSLSSEGGLPSYVKIKVNRPPMLVANDNIDRGNDSSDSSSASSSDDSVDAVESGVVNNDSSLKSGEGSSNNTPGSSRNIEWPSTSTAGSSRNTAGSSRNTAGSSTYSEAGSSSDQGSSGNNQESPIKQAQAMRRRELQMGFENQPIFQITIENERPVCRQIDHHMFARQLNQAQRSSAGGASETRSDAARASDLITDSSLRRFGNSDGENISYVHIGPGGAMIEELGASRCSTKPNKSLLRVLVCTGFSGVTNASLSHLSTAAPHLRLVDVRGTNVTRKAVVAFQTIQPECEVLYGKLDE